MSAPRTIDVRRATTLVAVWSAAVIVATLGTWLLFRANVGVNWGLVTLSASLALLGSTRWGVPSDRGVALSVLGAVALAVALAMGAAITADVADHVVIALAVCALLGIALGLACAPRPRAPDIDIETMLSLRAGMHLGPEFLRRVDETLVLASSTRWRPLVRGSALALPVVAVFALVLAGADPLLAAARDRLGELLTSWDAIPRALFFTMLFVVTAGACGLTARGADDATLARSRHARVGLGAVERAIVLGAVTLLFAAFLALQLSYLFGNPPGPWAAVSRSPSTHGGASQSSPSSRPSAWW